MLRALYALLPDRDSDPRGLRRLGPLALLCAGTTLYWRVDPNRDPEAYQEAKQSLLSVLDGEKRWPSKTGGTVYGDAGLIGAWGPIGLERARTHKAAERELRASFRMLTTIWYKEKKRLSESEAQEHPAYLKILGLGMRVILLMQKEQEIGRGPWEHALAFLEGKLS